MFMFFHVSTNLMLVTDFVYFSDFLKFYLDMEFMIFFSSQGRYLSRNLHQVIKNIIARAIDASAAATGVDPYR